MDSHVLRHPLVVCFAKSAELSAARWKGKCFDYPLVILWSKVPKIKFPMPHCSVNLSEKKKKPSF